MPIVFRSRQRITAFFDGLTVVDGGGGAAGWHPDSRNDLHDIPDRSLGLCGVARKD